MRSGIVGNGTPAFFVREFIFPEYREFGSSDNCIVTKYSALSICSKAIV